MLARSCARVSRLTAGARRGDASAMEPRDPDCPFCPAATLEPQLLAETRTFAVAADPRPLRDGHLILVPRAHLPSFAALPDSAASEWRSLLGRIERMLAREIGPA